MKKIVLLLLGVVFLCACNTSKDNKTQSRKQSEKAGGAFVIAEISKPISLFPHKLTRIEEAFILEQIYEPLVRLNPKTLELMPGLAERWEVSKDGKVITFSLRKGAHFHDDECFSGGKGREITTADVLYTFEKLCYDNPENLHYFTVCDDRIVGAKEYNEAMQKGEKKEISGIKIIDDYTFSITLVYSNYQSFLEILATPISVIIPKEAYNKYKTASLVGSGPYIYNKALSKDDQVVLVKNQKYYGIDKDGNALPYIDTLRIKYCASSEDAVNAFLNHQADIVSEIPNNMAKQIVANHINSFEKNPPEYIIDASPQMATQYVLININKPPFDNKKVRQAINYAINRNKMIEKVCNGQAYPATHGITPPAFKDYDVSKIQGYDFDLKKAKTLFAEAGYPDGKGFPTISIYVNRGYSRAQAAITELQRQLQEYLNINATFESLPLAVKFELEQKNKGNFFRQAWIADFPNPESFLNIFYGKYVTLDTTKVYFPNTQRYKNPNFDKLFEKGRDAIVKDTSYKYFFMAEQALMDDAPFIPLWYEASYRLYNNRIKGLYLNPMRYFDLREVFIAKNSK